MSLNIKSEEAHELTRELAALTGESMTEAVTVSVRERLAREREVRDHRTGAGEILRLGRQIASRLDDRTRQLDHGELLYDELGLPR